MRPLKEKECQMRSWGQGTHDGISALISRNTREFVHTHALARMLTLTLSLQYSEKAAVYNPGREFLPEPDYIGILIANL